MPIIKKVKTKPSGARPVLVEFQNSKIQPGKEGSLNSALYETEDESKLVGITTDKMLYTGTLANDELYNTFILIHNRKKNKIQLVQADHCTVSPRLNQKNLLTETTKLPLDNSISELNKQFGSKKARRVTEQRQRLTMNIETVKEQLEKTVTGEHILFLLNGEYSENTQTAEACTYRVWKNTSGCRNIQYKRYL
ncbi:hypothetical protein JTB14_030128 [Gonioctena quinquepunctata]|nr:hypothetical protein JTB14_030128 [Gonioctena quinquepunctata]